MIHRRQPLNQRQRAFARALAYGLTPAKAYAAAGFAPHRTNGARLARDPRIEVEVARLKIDSAIAALASTHDPACLWMAATLKAWRDADHAPRRQPSLKPIGDCPELKPWSDDHLKPIGDCPELKPWSDDD